jgi:hypothetical protein
VLVLATKLIAQSTTKLIAQMLHMQGKLSIEGDYLIVRPWLSVEYVDMQQPCISLTKLEITICTWCQQIHSSCYDSLLKSLDIFSSRISLFRSYLEDLMSSKCTSTMVEYICLKNLLVVCTAFFFSWYLEEV